MDSVQPKEVLAYADANGNEPYTQWIKRLRDIKARQKIIMRRSRVQQGNYGDYKNLGGGVCELKIDFGPGYRVYFGEDGHTRVIFLCGGDKSTQSQDIENARSYWKRYLEDAKTQNT
jgi:putative addiction module killer protein